MKTIGDVKKDLVSCFLVCSNHSKGMGEAQKTALVALTLFGLFFTGMGLYGYFTSPAMWGSYVVLSVGGANLLGAALFPIFAMKRTAAPSTELKGPQVNIQKVQKAKQASNRTPSAVQTPNDKFGYDPMEALVLITTISTFSEKQLFSHCVLPLLPAPAKAFVSMSSAHRMALLPKAGDNIDLNDFEALTTLFKQAKWPILRGEAEEGRLFFAIYAQEKEGESLPSIFIFAQTSKNSYDWALMKYIKNSDAAEVIPLQSVTKEEKDSLKALLGGKHEKLSLLFT